MKFFKMHALKYFDMISVSYETHGKEVNMKS